MSKCTHHWLGKKHSEETKLKMSASAIQRSRSTEYLQKLSESHKGERGSNWKGGVSKLGLPLYDTYAHQLWVDESRFIIENNLKLLQVKCSKCKSWFVPTTNAVQNRMKFLNGKILSECRFYCSDMCRNTCEIFRQYKYPKGYRLNNKYYNNTELDIWRNEVLRRANNVCEYCGDVAEIAHHIKTKKLNPFFALDPDYGIACCIKCHNAYGHKNECSTRSLADKLCE